MTRQAYLDDLTRLLRKLPAEDVAELIRDYDEHIRLASEHGVDETEVFKRLGDPKIVAKAVIAEYYLGLANTTKRPRPLLRAILASISLGFINGLIVVPPSAVVLVVLAVLDIVAAAMMATPVIAVYGALHGYGVTLIGLSLFVTGLGLFLWTGTAWLLKRVLSPWVVRYLRFNIRLAKGGIAP